MLWYLKVLKYTVLTMMLGVFLYGLIFYIDAPIKPCGMSFCGKSGHLYSLAQYKGFRTWEAVLLLTWIIGLPIAYAFSAVEKGKWPASK